MSTTNFWRRALVVAAFLLLAGAPAFAQQTTGSVFGTAVDEQGAALPGVTVTLTGGGAPQVFVTDAQGQFRFLGLSAGSYQLSAALEGFSTVEYPNINVSVARNTTVEITMSSAVEDVITVTAESPLLDERKITTGTTVSEVELEKIPTARDPWVILQQAPGVLVDRVNVGGNESGQQSQFISPGTNTNNSAWSVDGVVITDMGAVGSSPTYYNFDSFEEMQVSTGGTDVTLATGGVNMNMVTKRGTNEWRGSARYLLTDDTIDQADLDFDSGDLGRAGPFNNNRAQPQFQQGNQIIDVKDFGAELGGPIIRDRLWVWGSWGTQEVDLLTLAGVLRPDLATTPGFHDFTELPSYAVKLNAQIASNNSGIAFYHFGDKVKSGRNAGPTRDPATTWNQAGGTPIYKLEDTHIFNSSFYLSGMASFVDGGFGLTPVGGIEGDNTVWNNSLVWQNSFLDYLTERPQEQAKIDGDYFFNTGSSNHNLKFGVGLRNAVVTSFSAWGGRDRLTGLQPFGSGFARTDRNVENEMDYTNLYLQDTMTLGNLTANFGLRYDLQEGKINSTIMEDHRTFPVLIPGGTVPALDMPYDWASITPRVGLTYALGEERQTLLRASYARFADQLHSAIVEHLSPGTYRYGYFYWNDVNEDNKLTPNEVGDFYSFLGFDPANPTVFETVNSVDSSLDPPMTDELVLGVEHALMPEFVIGLNATYRIYSDILQGAEVQPSSPLVFDGDPVGSIGRRADRNDFVLFDHVVGTLPNGQSFRVPLYRVRPGLTTFGGQHLHNSDREQEYLGLSFTFNKRLSNNWLLRGHVTQSDWEWDVPNSAIINPHINPNGSFEDGSTVLSGSGTGSGSKGGIWISPGWSFDLSALYQIAPQAPWGFNVAANVNGREGYAVPYVVNVPNAAFGDTLGTRSIRVSPETDSFRNDDIIIVNGRLEKEFNFGEFGVTLGLDGFNLMNEGYVLQRQIQLRGSLETSGRIVNSNTGDHVTEIVNPRIFRIGARISFR
ncbi:MAG TPA: TonB-dependent receptor [Thermoanaerobaculia bacterium]|nr:TonB-dependent receptor [Thermoanaerobaculia bacterium]